MDPAQAIIDALRASGVTLTSAQENAIKRLTPAGASPTAGALLNPIDELQSVIDNLSDRNRLLDDGNNKVIRTNELYDFQRQQQEKALELAKNQMLNQGRIDAALVARFPVLQKINRERGDQLQLLDQELNKIQMIRKEEERLEKIRKGSGTFEAFGAKAAAGASAYINLLQEDISNLFDFSGTRGTTNKFFETLTADISQATQRMVKSYLNATFSEGKKMIFELSQAQADFNKEFGFGPEYTERIRTSYKELNIYGVTLKRVDEAQRALVTTVTDFTTMSESQQNALVEQVAVLSGLGVSAEAATKGIQASIVIFGQTGPKAAESMSEIAAAARYLEMSQTQVTNAFAASAGSLAKFGDQGVSTFIDLQRVFKNTGLEMEKVLNITNRFDTFEGAAEQAGKLNAALGGNFVNAMDLMMATDPVERFEMIRDSILDTGLSFDDMSYYQKIFYKDALGLSDIGDLAMMLRGNMNGFAAATNQSAESLIEQKERAQASLSVQEAFAAIISENAEELIDFARYLNIFVQGILDLGVVIKGLLPILGAYAIAQTLAGAATLFTGGAIGGSLFKMIAMAVAFTAISAAMLIESPSKLVIAMFAFGLAVAALGVIAGYAAGPIGLLAVPLIGVGLALAGAAAAVFLIIKSFQSLAASFTDLIKTMNPSSIKDIALGFQSLADALIVLGTDRLESFSVMVSSLAELTQVSSELSTVAKEIENIASAIDKIPEKKAIAFSSAMQNTAAVATAAGDGGVTGNTFTAAAPAATTVTRQPIQLFIDKDKMSEVVLDIMGGQVLKVIQQTGIS
jgi:hypothetical protein